MSKLQELQLQEEYFTGRLKRGNLKNKDERSRMQKRLKEIKSEIRKIQQRGP